MHLLDIGATRGTTEDVVARIPAVPGVYAWFKRIELRLPDASPAEFFEALRVASCSPHMPKLSAQIGPVHAVRLNSSRKLGESTSAQLRKLCESREFRAYIYGLLSQPHFLNSPLYIGKADDLRQRAKSHLDGSSGLLERLSEAQIDIRRCYLGWTPTPDMEELANFGVSRVVEDLVSQIFTPPFTLRYG
jgi:hypothetical protein